MPSGVDNAAIVQGYLDRGDYAGGYRHIAGAINGNPLWDQRLIGWFDAAAQINGEPNSFYQRYVFNSNAIAAGLDPSEFI